MIYKSFNYYDGRPEITYEVNLNPVVNISSYQHGSYITFNLWLGLGYVSFFSLAVYKRELSRVFFNLFNLSWVWDKFTRPVKRHKGGEN